VGPPLANRSLDFNLGTRNRFSNHLAPLIAIAWNVGFHLGSQTCSFSHLPQHGTSLDGSNCNAHHGAGGKGEREREVVVCEFKLGAETSHGHTLTGFPFVGGHVGVFGGPEAVDSGPW
jgi:hypothetical protein